MKRKWEWNQETRNGEKRKRVEALKIEVKKTGKKPGKVRKKMAKKKGKKRGKQQEK